MATQPFHIPIDRAGRLILPKEMRDRLGISAGTEFEVQEEDNKIILKPVPRDPEVIVHKDGSLVIAGGQSDPNVDIVKLIHDLREERIKKFIK